MYKGALILKLLYDGYADVQLVCPRTAWISLTHSNSYDTIPKQAIELVKDLDSLMDCETTLWLRTNYGNSVKYHSFSATQLRKLV